MCVHIRRPRYIVAAPRILISLVGPHDECCALYGGKWTSGVFLLDSDTTRVRVVDDMVTAMEKKMTKVTVSNIIFQKRQRLRLWV